MLLNQCPNSPLPCLRPLIIHAPSRSLYKCFLTKHTCVTVNKANKFLSNVVVIVYKPHDWLLLFFKTYVNNLVCEDGEKSRIPDMFNSAQTRILVWPIFRIPSCCVNMLPQYLVPTLRPKCKKLPGFPLSSMLHISLLFSLQWPLEASQKCKFQIMMLERCGFCLFAVGVQILFAAAHSPVFVCTHARKIQHPSTSFCDKPSYHAPANNLNLIERHVTNCPKSLT